MAKCPKCNQEITSRYLDGLNYLSEGNRLMKCPNCKTLLYIPVTNLLLLLLTIVLVVFLVSPILYFISGKNSKVAIFGALIIAFIFQYTFGWRLIKLKSKD